MGRSICRCDRDCEICRAIETSTASLIRVSAHTTEVSLLRIRVGEDLGKTHPPLLIRQWPGGGG
jgi:hypothetical protein